ncbi:hypothetical protein DFR86_09655 [Acidianus sulfidivorans JP7]|uniref:Uncharacterized protein n=1 Tax=Acidianus sulfidivorans JP7 TaxID=619593 RepID=A0A2U9IP73_9CREN|nr:hypothetical protein [Acidianus sulfidivorans]AWR97786.1 hypothetical protein DFR86_09655 [Acidianus sulfidivorans JP7]
MQKHDKCPYYKNGFCVSPMLDNPSDIVVSPDRCFKIYKTCRYYVETEEDKNNEDQGLGKFQDEEKIEQEVKFYPKVNLIQENIDSSCEFFQLMKMENGFIAYCKILERIITESQAKQCHINPDKCPLRNLL